MNLQNLVVYIIVFLCMAYAGKHIYHFFTGLKKGSKSCECGCSGCKLAQSKGCGIKKSQKKRRKYCHLKK